LEAGSESGKEKTSKQTSRSQMHACDRNIGFPRFDLIAGLAVHSIPEVDPMQEEEEEEEEEEDI
jgi:hypothetical protein